MDSADAVDIQASLAGDGRAYARIIARYQQAMAGRMWRFTRDRGELEGLVHDVFVEAYLSLGSYRGRAPLAHWLNRIATRVGYRYWKRRQRRERTVPLGEWDGPTLDDDAVSAVDAAEQLHVLLAQLRPRDRLVLTLLYLEELSIEDAAEQTGWSRDAVKVRAHRARQRLKAILEKQDRPKT